MLSLLEGVERVRRNEAVPEADLRALQNSANAVERFLAHSALSTISMNAARDHLIDALRAVDYADRQVLQTFLQLSTLLKQVAGVPQAVIRHGLALIERKQWAAGLEAISQAILFDQVNEHELSHDQQIWSEIAGAYEAATRTLGRNVHAVKRDGGPLRVGLLTSRLADNSATERLLAGWARHASADLASLRVYVTDSPAKPIRHGLSLVSPVESSIQSGARIISELKGRRIEPWISPLDADAVQTSRILTERIVRDQIELLLVDATLADVAIGMAVADKPASLQIAIQRGQPIPVCGIDEAIDANTHLAAEEEPLLVSRGIRTRAFFQGIEIGTKTAACRKEYGLSDDAVVMMTCCDDPARSLGMPFVRMVARLLAENPRAVYLLAGEGDFTSIRSVFESAGVAKRVGFAGRLKDAATFLSMADLYLAEFPSSSRDGVLTAMSCGKPVMILAGVFDQPSNARFVGAPYAVVGSPATLLDRCAAMIRDPQLRASVGASLQRRANEKFSMRTTIDHYMRLAGEIRARRPRENEFVDRPTTKLVA